MKFVVDASIAQAMSKSEKPQSRGCFESLDAIRKTNNIIVSSPRIRAEYRRHQSKTFAQWLKKMFARKLVCVITLTNENLEISKLEVLMRSDVGEKDLAEVSKDLHLFACALLTDNRVISCDEQILKRVFRAYQKVPFDQILWSNPQKENTSDWIYNGAKDSSKMQLRNLMVMEGEQKWTQKHCGIPRRT